MEHLIGHAKLPLLPPVGMQGGYGGKAYQSAVKALCKTVARIEGSLKMADRKMLAEVPESPDFFGGDTGIAKARSVIWSTVKDSPHIVFGFLADSPAAIQPTLPADWMGNGYRNVVFGTRVDGPEHLPSRLDALRLLPVSYRMLVIGRSVDVSILAGHLAEIHWVVMTGDCSRAPQAAALAEICASAKVPLAFFQSDDGDETDAPERNQASWLDHPFGPNLHLDQPPVPGIMDLVGEIDCFCSNFTGTKPVPGAPPAKSVARREIRGSGNRITGSGPLGAPSEKMPQTGIDAWDKPLQAAVADPEIPDEGLRKTADKPDAGLHPCEIVVLDRKAGERDFQSLDALVRSHLREFIAVGQALLRIREHELWREGGFPSWAAYCLDIGEISKNYANRLIVSAEIVTQIAGVVPIGTTLPSRESQVRPLAKLGCPEARAAAWLCALERADGAPPTAAAVAEEAAAKNPPAKSSKVSRPAAKSRRLAASFARLKQAVAERRPVEAIGEAVEELGRLLELS